MMSFRSKSSTIFSEWWRMVEEMVEVKNLVIAIL